MSDEVVEEKPKKGGKGLIIILLVILALLVAGISVLAYLLMSGDKGYADQDNELHGSVAHGESYGDGIKRAKQYPANFKQFDAPAPGSPPTYFAMEKFVVNFNGDGQAKFLAVDLQFMAYYPQVAGEMELLRPILKNDIQRLLRNQHFNALSAPEGPDMLREQILNIARIILEKHNVYPDLLEDVYMTRFVMQ